MSTLDPTTANGLDGLVERARDGGTVLDVFAIASERLRRLVPFDAAVWGATDPVTSLPAAPTRAENMEERIRSVGFDAIERFWESEFLERDFNSFAELTRGAEAAAGLHQATGGRPARSSRYREVLAIKGFGDEMRAVLKVGDVPWASFNLFRERGRPPFDSAEIETVSQLSRPLGEAVRERARPPLPSRPSGAERGPGLMMFAPGGELVSANDEALAWIEELPIDSWEKPADQPDAFRPEILPLVLVSTLTRARASALHGEGGTCRSRTRSAAGRWLVCHASCLRDADGTFGNTALVIEPAKSSEIAPLIVQAYGLTEREQEITQLLSRGASTAEMAERLFLSPHTVRDHLKAIFEKVGVSSRGEVVAKLFAEHYAPVHLAPENAEWVNDTE
jgi:DNA-binding CsgD family transcriptional regulator